MALPPLPDMTRLPQIEWLAGRLALPGACERLALAITDEGVHNWLVRTLCGITTPLPPTLLLARDEGGLRLSSIRYLAFKLRNPRWKELLSHAPRHACEELVRRISKGEHLPPSALLDVMAAEAAGVIDVVCVEEATPIEEPVEAEGDDTGSEEQENVDWECPAAFDFTFKIAKSKASDAFVCPICFDVSTKLLRIVVERVSLHVVYQVMLNPVVVTSCSEKHFFCKDCMQNHHKACKEEKRPVHCPLCHLRKGSSAARYSEAHELRRLIHNLVETQCVNEGCEQVMSLGSLVEHVTHGCWFTRFRCTRLCVVGHGNMNNVRLRRCGMEVMRANRRRHRTHECVRNGIDTEGSDDEAVAYARASVGDKRKRIFEL
jgi:hypothetical protein